MPPSFPDDVVEDPVATKFGTSERPDRDCFGAESEPIDVFLVYSPEALAAAGSDPAILENELMNAVDSANVTLWNSNVPTYLKIAGIEPAPITLVEDGSPADLANARSNPELRQRRRDLRADVVTYITATGANKGSTYCGVTRTQRRTGAGYYGIGYGFYDSAYQVVTWQCGVQHNDLSHEIGHNAGLDHNPPIFATRPPSENLYGYSYGHEVNGLFRDDMSNKNATICPDDCPRQMFFSDPTQLFAGVPRGIAGQKDNALTYRRSYKCLNTFADFIMVDGFE